MIAARAGADEVECADRIVTGHRRDEVDASSVLSWAPTII
jgi:hypothetical protein